MGHVGVSRGACAKHVAQFKIKNRKELGTRRRLHGTPGCLGRGQGYGGSPKSCLGRSLHVVPGVRLGTLPKLPYAALLPPPPALPTLHRATVKPVLVLLPVLGLTWLVGVLVHLSPAWAYAAVGLNSLQVPPAWFMGLWPLQGQPAWAAPWARTVLGRRVRKAPEEPCGLGPWAQDPALGGPRW